MLVGGCERGATAGARRIYKYKDKYRDKYKDKNKYKHKYRDNLVGSCELGATSGAEHERNGDVCYIIVGLANCHAAFPFFHNDKYENQNEQNKSALYDN